MTSAEHKTSLNTLGRLMRNFGYWIMILVACAAVVGMLLWAAGTFHHKVPEDVANHRQPVPPNAQIVTVESVTVPRFETAVGTIQAIRDASVASKILARVEEVNIIAGQKVKAGEVLVKLQSEDLVARLGQAESEMAGAEAKRIQAEAEYERAASLLKQRAVSQSEFQGREADLRSANAAYERAQKAVEESKVQLAYATVVAPFDGIIIDKLVKPGDTAAPGQPLLKLYDPAHMQLVAQVRESLALSLRPGQQILAGLSSLGYECEATISEVVPQANSATHSFEVKVIGPCPPGVYSGMFGRLKLPIGTEDVIVIPHAAIVRVGQLTMVNVAQDGHMERRNVQVGRDVENRLQVLAGLQPGEQVVVPQNGVEVQR